MKTTETGTIKFFNEEKGFGFISREGSKDIFVHKSAASEMLQENDHVEFIVEIGEKGPYASQVKVI